MITQTQALYIDKSIFNMAESLSYKLDFEYVGDLMEDILYRELQKMKTQEELYVKIQEGIDSGLVEVDDNFWLNFGKEIVIKNSFKYESAAN